MKIAAHLAKNLLKGIETMGDKCWMHRDLKPANLLLSEVPNLENYRRVLLKIGDFGLAKPAEFPCPPMTKEIMTIYYRAPEVMLNNLKYDDSIDLWSAGTIIFEMLTGQIMF